MISRAISTPSLRRRRPRSAARGRPTRMASWSSRRRRPRRRARCGRLAAASQRCLSRHPPVRSRRWRWRSSGALTRRWCGRSICPGDRCWRLSSSRRDPGPKRRGRDSIAATRARCRPRARPNWSRECASCAAAATARAPRRYPLSHRCRSPLRPPSWVALLVQCRAAPPTFPWPARPRLPLPRYRLTRRVCRPRRLSRPAASAPRSPSRGACPWRRASAPQLRSASRSPYSAAR